MSKNNGSGGTRLEDYLKYLHKECRVSAFLKAKRRVEDDALAEEMVETSFSNIAICRPDFLSRDHAKAYLFRTLDNTINDHFRKTITSKLDPRLEPFCQSDIELEVERAASDLAYNAILEKIRSVLEPAEWNILRMKYIEELSYREIGRILNRSVKGVKTERQQAVDKIRSLLPELKNKWKAR